MAKVGINGLGRIGRATFKVVLDTPELELVAVNDIAPIETIAYLLQYDTVYGKYDKNVEFEEGMLIIDGQRIPYLSERDPANLGWDGHGAELVFESTGFFTKLDGAQKHVEGGAKYVIVSAPTKSKEMPTVVHGVNGADGAQIISCASCTTNSIAPVMEILDRRIGVDKAIMTTIHAYTSTQAIVDGPNSKKRRGRAAAANFVPTSTGAAIATTLALPQLDGKFDGVAVRAPIPVGSISDITILTKRDTTVEEINAIFTEEAGTERYQDVMGVVDDELVSSDIVGDPRAAIIDTYMTKVIDGNLIKVMSWYDNEWGYTNQMVRQAKQVLGLTTVPV